MRVRKSRLRKRFIRMSMWSASKRLESLISDSAHITPINYGGKDKNTFLFTFPVTSAHNKVFSGLASWLNWSVRSWWDQIAVVGFELCFISTNLYFWNNFWCNLPEKFSGWRVVFMFYFYLCFIFIGIAHIKCPYMTNIIEIGVLRNCICLYDSPRLCKRQKRAYLYLVTWCVLIDRIAIIPFSPGHTNVSL